MSSSPLDFCQRAVAYLKVAIGNDGTPAQVFNDADQPILRSIGNDLLVAYLVDEGDHFEYIQNRHIRGAGWTVDELHESALKNLAAFGAEKAVVHQYGCIYAVIAGGDFEASMLLCDEFWTTWYADLAPNGFVAAFPARDILSFGDSAQAETILQLRSICERAAGLDHPLMQQLFQRVDGQWVPLP